MTYFIHADDDTCFTKARLWRRYGEAQKEDNCNCIEKRVRNWYVLRVWINSTLIKF